jgi:PPP family 3-phenylpropionic acid transporter
MLGRSSPAPPARLRAGLAALFRYPAFRTFLAATFLARFSAGAYNTFFTIQLDELGISQTIAGQAWALGVLCEVAVMAAWPRLVTRVGADRLLTLAIGSHAVRWWLMAEVTHPVAFLGIQMLHGLTFGAFYLAAVQLVDSMVPPDLRATGQGLFAASIFGLSGVAGTFLAGRLLDAVGLVGIYRLSAFIAVAATLLGSRIGGRTAYTPED